MRQRTIFHKLIRWSSIFARYFHAYTHFQGWRSYTRGGDEEVKLAGFAKRAKHRELFCADPFLFHYQDANWLFYETVNKAGKGMLGVLREIDGEWVDQGIVLEELFHLSYPQVFEHEGRVYMIPESCDFGKGNVSLYTTDSFPFGWRKVQTLIDKPFADATLLHHDGHWYMACYTIPPRETAELWHAPSLFGPWERHPQWRNINQSNRLRRCGGSFIRRGNALYRVAQDCNGPLYGKRLFKARVNKISPTDYEEGEATLLYDRYLPPYGHGHTYNEIMTNDRRLCVVDIHYDSWKNPIRIVRDVINGIKRKLGR